MEQRIAIIGAMDVEVEGLIETLVGVKQLRSRFLDMPISTGKLEGIDIVVIRCGVGKVHAALATQYAADHFSPSFIINSGVAGGLSPSVRIGDLVLGTCSIQHDFDVRKFGYAKGVIPSLASSSFEPDPWLLKAAVQAATEELSSEQVHQGLIVSGDQFISSREEKEEILSLFPEALCTEMEGAAIAHAATVNQIPHLIMRSISDQADNTAPHDFDQYLAEVIPVLNAVIRKTVAQLKN